MVGQGDGHMSFIKQQLSLSLFTWPLEGFSEWKRESHETALRLHNVPSTTFCQPKQVTKSAQMQREAKQAPSLQLSMEGVASHFGRHGFREE